MNPSEKPAAGMHLFYLDGAGILFSEATQELHLLNTTAAVIWSLLEEGHDAHATSAALQQMYGLDAERSEQFVVDALAEWGQKRFLGGPLPAPDDGPTAPAATPQRTQPPWRQTSVIEQRHYRILSSRFCLRFSSDAQARIVHPIVEHLEVRESSSEETAVDILETPDRLIVYRDREVFADCSCITELAPIVKSLVWVTVVRDHKFFLSIHAGVIGDQSKCILLPAPPGSGKSTLTASLVHAGFKFFSDEVALLEEGSFDVFPVPLAICVKASGIDALADQFPSLRGLQVHQRGDGKRVVYLPPPPESRPASDEPRLVAALVFPRYTVGATASLVPLSKFDALKHLMDECMVVSSPLDAPKVEALVEWISGTPCHSLSYGSTEDAVAAIRSVLAASDAGTQITGGLQNA